MTQSLQVGPLRCAVLDPSGSGVKTSVYYLPSPSKITETWIEKGINTELINGAESNRRLGFIPEVTITWSIYDDVNPRWGYAIGNANGQQLTFDGLMSWLDGAPGYISFSPGLTAGGFVVNTVKINNYGVMVGGFITDLQITLRSGTIYNTKQLGAF